MTHSLVQLYCYDLSRGMAASMSLAVIGRQLEGIWHTAVVVYGREFFFAGGGGIIHSAPGRTHFGTPQRIESLGTTPRTEGEFMTWISEQSHCGFGPNDYNILQRNCNHFTQEASKFLVGRDIPADIRNIIPTVLESPLGRILQPLIAEWAGVFSSQPGLREPPKALIPPHPVARPVGRGLLSVRDCFTPDEEESLMIARAMIQSNEFLVAGGRDGFDKTIKALTLLRSILVCILENPHDAKYREVSTSSQCYRDKLEPFEKCGFTEVLRLSGFRLQKRSAGSGYQWVLNDDNGSADILAIMVTHISDLIDAVRGEGTPFTDPAVGTVGSKSASVAENSSLIPCEYPPGEDILNIIMHDAVRPLSNLDELMRWSASVPGPITPAVPRRRRVTNTEEKKPSLLICHDMKGGYIPGDYPYFLLYDKSTSCSPRAPTDAVVDGSYTVSYWHLVDYFVYFSHKLVTIPPKEWISAAHREGVPALGTFITEGDDKDIRVLLDNAKNTAAAIGKLVEICNAYNFDGYLLNIETDLDEVLAKRLIAFISMLRQQLNKHSDSGSPGRFVIWYDAITTSGQVEYQNGLTEKNKPFFDVSNGLFINYWWRPYRLPISTAYAGRREKEIFVGVDVFGRGVYGGGGFDSDKAVACAAEAGLSSALFAPGWTLETHGCNKRDVFLHADAKMWSKMQDFFNTRRVEFDSLPLWTCFVSGIGKRFYVNGTAVVGDQTAGSAPGVFALGAFHPEWCQVSRAHFSPCYRLVGGEGDDAWCELPLDLAQESSGNSQKQGHSVPVEWEEEAVWMGDRSLGFAVPPGGVVTLFQFKLHVGKGGVERSGINLKTGVLVFLDIAWHCGTDDMCTRPARRVRVDGLAGDSVTHLIFDEQLSSQEIIKVVSTVGNWEIVRYTIPITTLWTHITSVAVMNASDTRPLSCTVGGIGFAEPSELNTHSGAVSSVLLMGNPQDLPSSSFRVEITKEPNTRVIVLEIPDNMLKNSANILLFATINCGSGALVNMYMGMHKAQKKLQLPLHIPPNVTVHGLFFHNAAFGC
ncbi:endo-beta-N-acetylglucosaminidase [Trypanosoma vivax]|nr:endo-beta-N-acetylglucosaminidase [Trypanosoma vivax]